MARQNKLVLHHVICPPQDRQGFGAAVNDVPGRTWGSGGRRSDRTRLGGLHSPCWPVTLSFSTFNVTCLGGCVSVR